MSKNWIEPDKYPPPLPTGPTAPGKANRYEGLMHRWYIDPYMRINFRPQEGKKIINTFQLMPPHIDNRRGQEGWYLEVVYLRVDTQNVPSLADKNIAQNQLGKLIEFPLLSNFGKPRDEDPIPLLSAGLFKKFDSPNRGGYRWLWPKRRYLFLAAYADPAEQANQKTPAVLELPGDYRDTKDNSGKSAGYTLAMLPREVVTEEYLPNFGELRYGPICIPHKQPVIRVQRSTGTMPQDSRYSVEVVTPHQDHWVSLKNQKLLEQLRPIETILNEPSMAYIAKFLRETVDHALIREIIPQFASTILGSNEALGIPHPLPVPTPAPLPTVAAAPVTPIAPPATAPLPTVTAAPVAAIVQPTPAPLPTVTAAPVTAIVQPTPAPLPTVAVAPVVPVPTASVAAPTLEQVIDSITSIDLPSDTPADFEALWRTLTSDLVPYFGRMNSDAASRKMLLLTLARTNPEGFQLWLKYAKRG